MSAKAILRWTITLITVLTVFAIGTIPAYAEPDTEPAPPTTEPACLNCHEDLYYLHDTGKWYCVSDASTRERCVLCHGGNPTALKKEAAHTNRSAYPVINGDVSKCQQCHPQDYAAHVRQFNKIAGISPVVYVASPYIPAAPAVVEPISDNTSQAAIYIRLLAGVGMLFIALVGIVMFWRKLQNKHSHR